MARLTRLELEDLMMLQRYVSEWFEKEADSFRIHRALMSEGVEDELVLWASRNHFEASFVESVLVLVPRPREIVKAS